MRSFWTMATCAWMVAALAGDGAAQNGERPAARSTLAGVYTKAQAARGRDTFAGMCQACHSPATHTGPLFLSAWGGQPLWVLAGYLREYMPKMDPGILSPEEYAQVVAYLLELNGMPAGSQELPADSASLSRIRFDTAATTAESRRSNR